VGYIKQSNLTSGVGVEQKKSDSDSTQEIRLLTTPPPALTPQPLDEVRPEMFNALSKGILWLNRTSSDMAFRKGTERLANVGDHHNTLEGKQERMH